MDYAQLLMWENQIDNIEPAVISNSCFLRAIFSFLSLSAFSLAALALWIFSSVSLFFAISLEAFWDGKHEIHFTMQSIVLVWQCLLNRYVLQFKTRFLNQKMFNTYIKIVKKYFDISKEFFHRILFSVKTKEFSSLLKERWHLLTHALQHIILISRHIYKIVKKC